jgi:hypothetical protein
MQRRPGSARIGGGVRQAVTSDEHGGEGLLDVVLVGRERCPFVETSGATEFAYETDL